MPRCILEIELVLVLSGRMQLESALKFDDLSRCLLCIHLVRE